MSQDDVQRTPPWAKRGVPHEAGQEAESETLYATPARVDTGEPAEKPVPTIAEPTETVGTGTSIALGCVAGTILLIIFGLAFLALVALL